MVNNGPGGDTWSRREIDMAIGVLIGLRQCSERQAFNEIASAVGETGIGLVSICRALVELASGADETADYNSPGAAVWGDLLNANHSDNDDRANSLATPCSIPRASSSTSGAAS